MLSRSISDHALASGGDVEPLLTAVADHENARGSLDIDETSIPNGLTQVQAQNLYFSHLLSTWNARTYEFAAILFTAAAYPDTLIASAVRGIVTTAASICLSSSIGRWIDRAPNRLRILLTTITTNRLSVICACVCWYLIVGLGNGDLHERIISTDAATQSDLSRRSLFSIAVFLGIFEKLSGAGNMMSMERDWVVTVASPNGQAYGLSRLNAVMRRIDLICKLVAPILISAIISTTSIQVGVFVVGGMSGLSWGLEWWCAKRVWDNNPALRMPKDSQIIGSDESGVQALDTVLASTRSLSHARSLWSHTVKGIDNYFHDFKRYFSTNVWIPSLALCLLHLTVLSYSSTLITYLLNVGFSLNLITVARAVGSMAEISSTLVTPFGIEYLGKARHHHRSRRDADEEDEDSFGEEPGQSNVETGLERLGLWGIMWQLINLIPVVLFLWALSPTTQPPLLKSLSPHPLLAMGLFTFLSLSRLGLWIFDLTTQQLTQTLVEAPMRSSFAGVETSFASLFELGSYAAAIAFSRPSQFRYLAAGSLGAVGISTVLYAGWVWKMRGHLVHWERVGKGCKCIS